MKNVTFERRKTLPWSKWCRSGQHWACRRERGQRRDQRQKCECRCHQT